MAYQYGCATGVVCHGVNVVMNAECRIATVRAVTVQNVMCVTIDSLILYILKNDTGCIVLNVN
ncbi:hypothetical protein [Bacillus phage SPbetaL4]|nr:hypothetical protein [Bacillus phage SPbetaL4]